jgi:hypothetical protein
MASDPPSTKEDEQMTDAEPDQGQAMTSTSKAETEEDAPPVIVPPLEAAAQRLERLLGGSASGGAGTSGAAAAAAAKTKEQLLYSYINPGKVVRRWLGTSSGAAAEATAEGIQSAAAKLLDSEGSSSAGRALLTGASLGSSTTTAMHMDEGASREDGASASAPAYLVASAREVESWLISLAVRLLWKEKQLPRAFEVAQQGIAILMAHLEEASLKITSVNAAPASSLFPLLARMFRLRALVAEDLNDPAVNANLRTDMARAHNRASLRRDVDTQATLLNCMLRDLLRNSQGACAVITLGFVGSHSFDSCIAHTILLF